MSMQKNTKFNGGLVKRVFVIYPKSDIDHYNDSTLDFIKNKFNTLRNYREFTGDLSVEILVFNSDSLPEITTLKEGDACLLMGRGRFIDKECYTFAQKCFIRSIPVFFIRANSMDYDSRNPNSIWRQNPLITKKNGEISCSTPPAKYFMEIPKLSDLLRLNCSDALYALFPAMVPVS